MASDWLKIRSWNGSQNHAFEELCCQLAEYEQVPTGFQFTRKGAPDAGVECFWTLSNGDEWGWQAKFFVSSLSDGQWAQLDESVNTALEKHPHLKKYIVCLPHNFSDAREAGKKSALERWKEHVIKWEGEANKRGMTMEVILWGETKILSLLSNEEHRGRYFFWFNEVALSREWFKNQLDAATANAGPRYTPELNVDVPIARNFDGLGRTPLFYNRIRKQCGKLKRQNSHCYPTSPPDSVKQPFQGLRQCMADLLAELEKTKEPTSEALPFDRILSRVSECKDKTNECIRAVEEYDQSQTAKGESAGAGSPTATGQYHKSLRDYRYDLGELYAALRQWEDFLQSKEAQLANTPALLIVGDAGMGKTHLLCDVAQKRLGENIPSILLLGEQFTSEDPWTQIIKLVGLGCVRDEFLGALDAAGAAARSRALILIDALNEGEGNVLWAKHLAGMLTTLARYKYVGIAITARTSYETSVVPEGLVPKRLVRAVHEGFSDTEYAAMQVFFDHFGVQHPSVPLLAPEFQNPLFLKIFCQSLKNLGLTRVPTGLTGITQLLDFFLESVNSKLSRPDRLDFDPKDHPVHVAINKLAEMMASRGKNYLSYGEARDTVNAVLPRDGFARSFFKNLLSEGVIAQERILVDLPDKYEEIIRFAYERFTDHLVVRHLLDLCLPTENFEAAFAPESRLGELFKDQFACWRNRGLLEALCVQVPERIGKEIPDLVPHCAEAEALRLAFVDSLIWRNPHAISEATLNYVNKEIVQYQQSHDKFLDALLTVATNPEHPYNSRLLHRHLSKFGMADRDQWWSIFLHQHYGDAGAIDRLIDWAWVSKAKSQVSDDSVLLAAVALGWFLTSSNRYLRDRTTKALVSLLTSRIQIVRRLLQAFRDVNDPYVAERIYAVAYGCSLKSTDGAGVAGLAQDVYDHVFKTGKPLPHVLLRDYARGVIEIALQRGAKLAANKSKFRPPYKTKWPSKIPSAAQLEKKYGTWYKGMPDDEIASRSIFSSVMSGDFGRYIIGTNSGRREYSSRRLGRPAKPTYKKRHDSFWKSLTKVQKVSFSAYEKTYRSYALDRIHERLGRLSTGKANSVPSVLSRTLRAKKKALRSALGEKKYRTFAKDILPFLENPAIDQQKDSFDLRIAQRWILKRILDLGWTVEKFGRFDRNTDLYTNRGRDEHKAERIGKKYQWIAYHEFLALMLDNFEFRGDWGSRPEKYDGPWQIFVRDIDPSVTLTRTRAEHRTAWWAPASYDVWDENPDDGSWIADVSDVPDPKSMLVVTDPKDGSRWLTLQGWYFWEQPSPPEQDRFENQRREIWSLVRGYLVRIQETDRVFDWAKKQDFMGRWMPENGDFWRVFLGEFPWAPSYRFHDQPYYNHQGWTQGRRKEIPTPVLACAEAYLGESTTRDCSVSDSIHVTLPPRFIVEGMGLRWNGVEGSFFDAQGNLVAFDPSVTQAGPSALLIKKEPFQEFLHEAGCDLFWMFLGEKQMIGGHMTAEDWKGRLEISGAFRRSASGLEGGMTAKHRKPGGE